MQPASPPVRIDDLASVPRFRTVVAARVWAAWWRDKGVPLDYIEGRVAEALGDTVVPSALVARAGDEFVGTVSLIENDLDARPELRPWVAALWVEPGWRRRGIGGRLVAAAARRAFDGGAVAVHLCATPQNTPFYRARGWRTIEAAVDGVAVLRLEPGNIAG